MQSIEILLIISHPDDDAIFAGELQRRFCMFRWGVACITQTAGSLRAEELRTWQTWLGTRPEHIFFLNQPDDPGDYRHNRCSIDQATVEQLLGQLHVSPRLVVTHNDIGEYGHPHHMLTHRAACNVFAGRPLLWFGYGKENPHLTMNCAHKWDAVERAYPSQAEIIRRFQTSAETFVYP